MARTATPPAGLVYVDDFISVDEEDALVQMLDNTEFESFVMQGQEARRKERHYGYDYSFESGGLTPTEPWPEELHWLRERAAQLANVKPLQLAEVLATKYPINAGIGWHRDAPKFGIVVGISLLSACKFRFRRGKVRAWENYDTIMLPRSAYVLSGAARWTWQHHIPTTESLRYSITFRTLR